eukprot:12406465-Karenia_brevis.AAC.1
MAVMMMMMTVIMAMMAVMLMVMMMLTWISVPVTPADLAAPTHDNCNARRAIEHADPGGSGCAGIGHLTGRRPSSRRIRRRRKTSPAAQNEPSKSRNLWIRQY